MATINDIKRSLRRLEGNARRQIKALQKGVENALPPRLPIGPGPLRAALKAVRKVRREVTSNLAQVERALLKQLARPAARRR
jgi:hypothetical protein